MSTAGRGQRPSGGPRSFWSGYDELWGLTEAPTPRRGTGLDRDTIVRTAIALADADGIEGVTMRRVAERLGTGAMSLYRHVPDKDALVSMMVDAVLGEDGPPGPDDLPPDWRDGLRLLAEATWRIARAHPWYPEETMVRPPFTPNGVAGLELALAIFDGYDIDVGTKMQFIGAVHFGVLSAALNLAVEERARATAGVTEEEVMTAAATFLQHLVESGRYPRVASFVTGTDHVDDETRMRASVELILDGIATRLESPPPGRAEGSSS